MRSQKPRVKRVSAAASQAFEVLVRDSGLQNGNVAGWKESLEGDGIPKLDDFQAYWKGVLGDEESGQKLLDAIPQLVNKYPVEGEGEDQPRPGVQYIEDVKAFKSGLNVSVDPGPLVQWGDLPLSKF